MMTNLCLDLDEYLNGFEILSRNEIARPCEPGSRVMEV